MDVAGRNFLTIRARCSREGRLEGAALAAVLAAVLGLGACAAPAPVPEAVSNSAARPTIVSLNPCLDAILVEIAPQEQIVALSHYSRDAASSSLPPEARGRFAFTGGTAEEVLAASPDLVLASTFMDPATRAAFEQLGVRVATFGAPATVGDSIAQVREVARITGNEAAGERLARAMAEAARPQEGLRPISTLLWQPGQIVPGDATLIADLLRRQGMANFAAARGLGQSDYVSLESVLAAPPELLLVAGDSAGQSHPLLAELAATRVETFSGNLVNCGGPVVIAASARLRAIRAGLE